MRRRLDVTLRLLAICGLSVIWVLALTVSWLLGAPRDATLWVAVQARAAIAGLRADMSRAPIRIHWFRILGLVVIPGLVWTLIILVLRGCA